MVIVFELSSIVRVLSGWQTRPDRLRWRWHRDFEETILGSGNPRASADFLRADPRGRHMGVPRATALVQEGPDLAGATMRMPAMWAYQPSRLWACCAASWCPAPVAMRITNGMLNWPPDRCRIVSALQPSEP